jgi:hypothetical protein
MTLTLLQRCASGLRDLRRASVGAELFFWQQRAHKAAFVPKDAAAVIPDPIRFNKLLINAEQSSVFLVPG